LSKTVPILERFLGTSPYAAVSFTARYQGKRYKRAGQGSRPGPRIAPAGRILKIYILGLNFGIHVAAQWTTCCRFTNSPPISPNIGAGRRIAEIDEMFRRRQQKG
jgi:hypothetical protein